ncbi:PfkB family carbohydrate kinase, partial [Enterococcus faecalis]|uniref:PfkB family carbohydrate kinase n=1 Tax=Enterococcus faecalis TaxID=1351 RepID=UPI003CC58D62
ITTAAGDSFIGALCRILDKDYSNLEEAFRYGYKSSSLTVQSFGAQPSIPFLHEVADK